MNEYKLKISLFEIAAHTFTLLFTIFIWILYFISKPDSIFSFERFSIETITVSLIIWNFYLLYKKRNGVVEIDNSGISYPGLIKQHYISFSDITKIERTSWNPKLLTMYSSRGRDSVPLGIEHCSDFLYSLICIVETKHCNIAFNKDNILSLNKCVN